MSPITLDRAPCDRRGQAIQGDRLGRNRSAARCQFLKLPPILRRKPDLPVSPHEAHLAELIVRFGRVTSPGVRGNVPDVRCHIRVTLRWQKWGPSFRGNTDSSSPIRNAKMTLIADLRPVALLAAIPLAACAAAPPSGPTVFALPRSGESLNQFQANDLTCRNYAQINTAPPGATQAAANRSAVGSAAVGTAVGAAGGALLGAAAGNAGVGAAIGAGAGLLTGSAVGASNAGAIAGGAQAQYDVAYAQCMTSKGDIVETAPPGYGYAYPDGYPYYAYAYPGGYPYYGAYPYFIATGPFFFGPHFHDDFHHDHFHGGVRHGGFGHGGSGHGGFGHGGFGGGHFGH
jgi:Glycine-zipper domain